MEASRQGLEVESECSWDVFVLFIRQVAELGKMAGFVQSDDSCSSQYSTLLVKEASNLLSKGQIHLDRGKST